ncbi:hypothetical protein FRB97_001533 [Tulasnella sp. 331]|nr:hypothetical protein FRB97_001533 [Tulasnella sp. 331]
MAYAQQNPPVARIGVAYTHSFPQSVIFPSAAYPTEAAAFVYTADAIPGWLTFTQPDNTPPTLDPILTFSGTPKADDDPSTWVKIVRTSSAAQNATTMTRGFRLFVSGDAPPTIDLSFTTQIFGGGTESSLSAVLSSVSTLPINITTDGTPALSVPSTWSFSIGFRSQSFQSSAARQLYYTATLADGQPLPTWLTFANKTMTFGGFAPDLYESRMILPQAFNVSVGCTDVWSTEPAVSQAFMVVVTPDADQTTSLLALGGINVTVGTQISYNVQQALNLALQGMASTSSPNISTSVDELAISVDLSQSSTLQWLRWNTSDFTLVGTVPDVYGNTTNATVVDIPISISSTPSSFLANAFPIANLSIPFNIYPSPFNPNLPFNVSLPSSLQPNDTFYVDLSGWLLGNGTVQIVPVSGPLSNGLSYNVLNNTLEGSIPVALTSNSTSVVMISVTSQDNGVTTSNTINIAFPSPLIKPTTNNSSKSNEGAGGGKRLPKSVIIALAVIVALVAVFGLFAVVCCLSRTAAVRLDRVSRRNVGDREHDENAMDFHDASRNSYSRPYEKYRGSGDTTTVVGSGGGAGKKFSVNLATPTAGADGRINDTPTRQDGGLGHKATILSLPKSPKAREPGFDMVNVASSSAATPVIVMRSQTQEKGGMAQDGQILPQLALTKPSSPSPKKPQTAPIMERPLPAPIGPVGHSQTHSRNTSASTTTLDKPKRMSLMRVFRLKSNMASASSSPTRHKASNPRRSEADADFSGISGSEDGGGGRGSKKRKSAEYEDLPERGMSGRWSCSRYSTDTFSSTGTGSWESEELWRSQKQAGMEPSNSNPNRSSKASKRRPHQHTSCQPVLKKEVSPSQSSGRTMAEQLRKKMARMGGGISEAVVDSDGTPDSVIPRRRHDFRPPKNRASGGIFSEEEGEYTKYEEDVFGVVKAVSIPKTIGSKSPHRRAARSSSSLLPSPMLLADVSGLAKRKGPVMAAHRSKSISGSEADEVGRSFPDESLHYEEYGDWLKATMLASGDEDNHSGDDDTDDPRASSYHQAALVSIGGNLALRQALVSPLKVTPNATSPQPHVNPNISKSISLDTPSPVLVTQAVAYGDALRSSESSDESSPELQFPHSPNDDLSPQPNSSMTSIDTPSIVLSSSTSVDRLKGLGYSESEVRLRSIYPLSQSKQTVRLVHSDEHVNLSPDSISSMVQTHAHAQEKTTLPKSPTIVVQDTSDFSHGPGGDVPLQVLPAGRPFSLPLKRLVATNAPSGRSTPVSFASSTTSSAHHRTVIIAKLENDVDLPEWLHFDPHAVEFWGKTREEDAGGHWAVKIVEHRPAIGLPPNGRRTPSMILDEGRIVARLIMVVSW